jgi:SAM-dependent methyltransferase
MGRHARALVGRGYSVIGIERDALVIAQARELAEGPSYVQADIRDYRPNPSAYDVAIIMSQSFGYFSPTTNRDVFRQLTTGLREGGRIILDLWSPEFFTTHQGERDLELPDGIIRERKRVEDGRLFVHLDYPDGGADEFEWELFTPAEMSSLAESTGLALIVCCTDFDTAMKPYPEQPRIQFVLERPSA